MGLKDDEEELISPSVRPEKVSRAEKKKEALKRKIREEGKQVEARKLEDLKSQVQRGQLLGEIEGEKDEEKKRKERREEEESRETFGTKTLMEEEEPEIRTAQEKPDAERLIEDQKKMDEAQEQAGEERQQQPG